MMFEASSTNPVPGVGSFSRVMWANVAVAVVASALLIAVVRHLPWPAPADSAVVAVGATALSICSAVVTLAVTALTVVQRRRWTWATAAWSMVVVCAFAGSAGGRPDFSDSQRNFEEVAHQLLREAETAPSDRYRRDLRIDRFDLAYAYVGSEGAVYFHDARTGLSPHDNPGWVYAPEGLSDTTIARSGLIDIDTGWYSFSNLVVDDYRGRLE